VARLAATNLRSELQEPSDPFLRVAGEEARGALVPEQVERITRRLGVIGSSLDRVSRKLLDLLKFSQRMGFVRATTEWNDVIRDVLIWLAAERQRRDVEVHVVYGDLPPLFIEPNELFGVLVTILRLAMEALEPPGGLFEIHTTLSADGQRVRTEVFAPVAPLAGRVSAILEPATSVPEELSPLHFEWALAQETVAMQYEGSLSWQADNEEVCFVLELPLEKG
jgi:signal transduction histidine kinase